MIPFDDHYVFCFSRTQLPIFPNHSQEASEGNCFIFKNGDKPSRMIIILGKCLPNYYPWQCFSPKVLLLEANHIWDCSLTTGKTLSDYWSIVHWVNITPPSEPSGQDKPFSHLPCGGLQGMTHHSGAQTSGMVIF